MNLGFCENLRWIRWFWNQYPDVEFHSILPCQVRGHIFLFLFLFSLEAESLWSASICISSFYATIVVICFNWLTDFVVPFFSFLLFFFQVEFNGSIKKRKKTRREEDMSSSGFSGIVEEDHPRLTKEDFCDGGFR